MKAAIEKAMHTSTTSNPRAAQAAPNPTLAPASSDTRPGLRLSTEDLFAGNREIALMHNGREYRLRITQQGKLLLTA